MSEGLQFGAETYRAGAFERIEESRLLLDRARFALGVYVGGLAVEGMLRSLCWTRRQQLDERHDLRAIVVRVRDLGLLHSAGRDDRLVGDVAWIATWWSNTQRYAGLAQLKRLLVRRGGVRPRDLNRLRSWCEEFFSACLAVVNRCERIWQHLQRRS